MEKEFLIQYFYRTQTDKGYGLIFDYDKKSKTLFEPQYKEIELEKIADTYYRVKTDKGYGLIYAYAYKKESKVLIEPLYKEVGKISNHLYKIKTDLGFGLVNANDKENKTLFEAEYKEMEIQEIADNYYLITTDLGYGLINAGYESKILVEPSKKNNLISTYDVFAIECIEKINRKINQITSTNKYFFALNFLFTLAIIVYPNLFQYFWNYPYFIFFILIIIIPVMIITYEEHMDFGGMLHIIFLFCISFGPIIFLIFAIIHSIILEILLILSIILISFNIWNGMRNVKGIKKDLEKEYKKILNSKNIIYKYSLLKELKNYLYSKEFEEIYFKGVSDLLEKIEKEQAYVPEHVEICDYYSRYWNIQSYELTQKAKEVLNKAQKKFSLKSIVFKKWIE